MTRQAEHLAEQYRRALHGEAWHGPSILELLAGVSATDAASHPIAGAHSIWELVLHLGSDHVLASRLLAGDGRQLTAEESWPACPEPTHDNWLEAVASFTRSANRLQETMGALSDDRLHASVVHDDADTAYVLFSGITQHHLYHAGQMALLKQAIAAHQP
jgi:hypothetical protein